MKNAYESIHISIKLRLACNFFAIKLLLSHYSTILPTLKGIFQVHTVCKISRTGIVQINTNQNTNQWLLA